MARLAPTLIACLACASAPEPVAAPVIAPQEAARRAELERVAEAERRAAAKLALFDTYDAANLMAVSEAERAQIKADAMVELARLLLEDGDAAGAVEAVERAHDIARLGGGPELVSSVAEDRFLIRRFEALDAVRRGELARATERFDRLSVLPGLTPAQRRQVAGDRLVLLELEGDRERNARNAAVMAALSRLLADDPADGTGSSGDVRRSIGLSLGLAVADATLPSSELGPIAETGSLSPSIVQQVVRENRRSISLCYGQSLKRGARLDGRLEVEVTVEPNGSVSAAEISVARLRKSELGRCVSETVARWRFPPFAGDARQVIVPFVLSESL